MKWTYFIAQQDGNPDFHILDDTHTYKFVYGDAEHFEDKGWPRKRDDDTGMELVIVGVIVHHKTANGDACGGHCTFARPLNPSPTEAKAPLWEVQSLKPLTLSPSVQCHKHPQMHGFIQEDKWVRA